MVIEDHHHPSVIPKDARSSSACNPHLRLLDIMLRDPLESR
jgi:hypothetical protein